MAEGVTRTRLILNLTLLGLLLVLVALAVLDRREVVEPPKPKLSTIDPNTVATITITRPKQEAIVLAKAGKRWQLKRPLNAPADESRVQSLLDLLGDESQESFPAKDHDLKRFGLAEPAVVVQFDNRRLALGETNPLSAQRYVLYEDRVHLVFDSVYEQLQGQAASFASPRLIEEGREPVRIALPERTLLREGDRGWILRPPQAGVTTDALTRLADEWRYARAVTVRALKNGKRAEAKVILAFKEGGPITYEIRSRDPALILARPELGLEYEIPGPVGKRLLAPEKETKKKAAAVPAPKAEVPPPPPEMQ